MIKLAYKIHSMFNGIRIYAAFLSVVCLFTTLSGLYFFTMIYNETVNYRLVKSNTLGDAYYFCDNGLDSNFSPSQAEEYKAALYKYDAIDKIFTFKFGCDVARIENGRMVYGSICLLEPDFYNYFPLLKSMGLDFSEDPDGCIIGSNFFRTAKGENQIDFIFWFDTDYKTTKNINVCGRLKYPYKFICPNGGGTNLRLSDLIEHRHIVIMQDTENVRKLIERNPYSHAYFIITMKNNASDEDIQAALEKLNTLGSVKSFEQMLEEEKELITTNIKNLIPRPLFNLSATLIAFLSMVILLVRKKQKEMAIAYVCGASKGQIIATMIGGCCLVTLIPCILNGLLLLKMPYLDSDGLYDYLSPDLIWVIAVYFAITVIISALSVSLYFAKRSPIENLRGLE